MKSFNNFIVNIEILKNNALNIKKHIGKNTKFCAVVKANGYGIGLETVCKSLKGIADFFACACLKEALSIRVFDKNTPILILGYIDNNDLNIIYRNNISISIGSYQQLCEIKKYSKHKINIHLQINTGLNRFGIRTIKEFKKCINFINSSNNLNLEGVYSHFATKDNDITFINKQFLRFLQFKKIVNNKNVIFHIANSYATIHSKSIHLDMVRSGYLLYGYTKNNIDNKPVLKITSKIINVMSVRKGDTIGYDRTYVCSKSMKVGVVPIGYADGLNRKLSNNFSLLVKDKKCPILGRVCMDVVMIDITNVEAQVGDNVIILGTDKDNSIYLNDFEKAIDTSGYEILCNFNYKRMNYIISNKYTKI